MADNSINIPNINIGSLIAREFKRSGMTQVEFARRLNIPPSNVTRIFKKETIETSKLMELCDILDYNFFSEYCSDLDNAKSGYSLKREIQIGTIIESRLRSIKMTQVEFANHLGVKQPVISRILKKESIDTGRLIEISNILDYNFFSDFYESTLSDGNQEKAPSQSEIPMSDSSLRQWGRILKRNEELVSENAKLKEYLREVYSQMQKFKQDNEISIDNWDALTKREGVDVMNMATFFFLDSNIKKILDEPEQADPSETTEKE